MITTQTIRLKKPKEFDNQWIENQLADYNVIRWAIIDVTETELVLSVSTLKAVLRHTVSLNREP